MDKITIEGSPKPVSRLIKGSDYFRHDNYDQVVANLNAFLAIGGNTIDTAHVYTGGQSEEVIGRYMKEMNNRDQLVIFTKGAHPDRNGVRVNKEAIDHDVSVSLTRLGTDYIDLYGLHRDDPSIPVQHIMDALNEHIEAGRIGAIGASNWTWERIQEANQYAKISGLKGFTFSSPNLSLAKAKEPFWPGCISVDEDTSKFHERSQIPVLSWSSQARGFFTGRYTPDILDNEDLVRVFYSDDNWERLRRAEKLAKHKGVTTIQIALAYVLNQPYPTCALIGAQNPAELTSCEEGAEIRLTEEEVAWLDLSAATITNQSNK